MLLGEVLLWDCFFFEYIARLKTPITHIILTRLVGLSKNKRHASIVVLRKNALMNKSAVRQRCFLMIRGKVYTGRSREVPLDDLSTGLPVELSFWIVVRD